MSEEKPQDKARNSSPDPSTREKSGRWRSFFRRWRRKPFYALFRMTVLFLAVAALFLYGFYRHYQEDIRTLISDLVQSQSSLLLEPGATFSRMDMPAFGHFIFHNLRIADPFEPQRYFLEARRVQVEIDPLRLIWRGINLGLVSIEGARVWIHQDSLGGKFNVERLFKQTKREDAQAPEPTGPGLRIRIRDFRILGTRVLLEDIDEQPIDNEVPFLHGTFTRIDGENVVEVLESRLSTDYRDVGLAAVSGIITIVDVRLGLQEMRVLKGQTDLTGAGWVDFHEKTYHYELGPGALDLAHLPRELGLEENLNGIVDLSAAFSGKFDSTFIQAEIGLESGTLFEYPVHNLSAQITYTANNLGFARIRSGIAGGGLEGRVEFDFTEGREGYQAEIQAREIDLSRLKFDWSEKTRGRISGILNLRGRGYSEDEMELEIQGRAIRGQMFDIPLDSCRVEYNLHTGHSRIDNLVLYSQGAVATAIGDIYSDSLFIFVLVEQFPAARLAEWFPIEGLGGMAEFSGSLKGNLEDPDLNGTFSLSDGKFKQITFTGMEGSCELRNLVSGINGKVDAQFNEVLLAERELESIRISGTIPDSGALRFDSLVVIEDSLNAIFSSGYYLQGERQGEHHVTLDSLNLLYAGANVAAGDKITIFRREDTTSVSNLRLTALGGSLRGNIVVSDSGWFDSDIAFSGLDLSLLPEEFRPQFKVSGFVTGTARVGGTRDQPTGAVALRAVRPVFAILVLDSLDGRMHLDRHTLWIDSLTLFNLDTMSTLSGRIPLGLDSAQAVTAETEFSLRARFNSFPLSSIRTPTVPLTAGLIDGELDIRGTAVKPVMSGELKLTDGAGLITPINTRLQNMSGRVVLEPRELRLLDLVSSSPEGKLQASGRVSLDGLKPESVDIKASGRDLVLQQFKYVTTLRVNADMNLQGPLDHLSLNGVVRVVEGEVNPALGGAPAEEEAEVEASPEIKLPVLPFDFNIQVTAQDNFWLRNRNTGIKLAANIRASQSDSTPSIQGQITTVSGYYSVYGRRFQIKYGSIQFQGGATLNPLLEINAERTIRGRVLRSELSGSSYTMRGATGAGTGMPSEQYEMDSNTFVLHIGGTLNNPQIEIYVLDQNRREIEPPITPEMARTLVLVDQTYREFNQQSGMSQSKLLDQAANMALSQANPYLQEWTGIDEFSIESQFFTRTPGEDPSSERAGATLTMGEFLFEKVFFSFSQDLVDPSARSGQIEYLINQNSSIIGQTDSRGHFSIDFRYLYKY